MFAPHKKVVLSGDDVITKLGLSFYNICVHQVIMSNASNLYNIIYQVFLNKARKKWCVPIGS